MHLKRGKRNGIRQHAVSWAAGATVIVAYIFAREPAISLADRQKVAARFEFSTTEIAADWAAIGMMKEAKDLRDDLKHISAWALGTRAAATVGDLDGDGIENDLLLVDTRVDRLIAMPVPGTQSGPRGSFVPFAFEAKPLTNVPSKTISPSGSLIGDFNEDGLPDVLAYYWGRTPVLFLRKASTLPPTSPALSGFHEVELVPALVGTRKGQWFTHAATQADFDGDGHLDFLIGNFFQDGADILNPKGTVATAVMHHGKSRARNGGGAKLFTWQSGTVGEEPIAEYTNKTAVMENLCGTPWVLAAGAADLDDDGLPELYLANDFGPDRLLHNRSKPGHLEFAICEGVRSFTTPRSFVLGQDSFKGMGVGFGDVNRDGHLDIFVSNIADDWALQESHFLWLNTGKPEQLQQGIAPFIQRSESLGLSRSGWGWDSVLVDLDNDGFVEAVQATGFAQGKITDSTELSFIDKSLYSMGLLEEERGINRWPELQAVGTTNDELVQYPYAWPKLEMPTSTLSGYDVNPIYARSKSGKYVDISTDVGIGKFYNTRAIAVADVDRNGLQDFVYGNQGEPSVLVHNECQINNRYLALQVVLPTDKSTPFTLDPREQISGRPAIGAVAEITSDISVQRGNGTRIVGHSDGGSGHSGHGTKEIHFGLGNYPGNSDVRVRLRWRNADGMLARHDVELKPGRHTVILGTLNEKGNP